MKKRIKTMEIERNFWNEDLSDLTEEEIDNLPDFEEIEYVTYDLNILEKLIKKLYDKFICEKRLKLKEKSQTFIEDDEEVII